MTVTKTIFGATRVRLTLTCATAALLSLSDHASAQATDLIAGSGTFGTASVTGQGTVSVTTQDLTSGVLSSIEDGDLAQSSAGAVGNSSVEITANDLLATARGNVADTEGQLLGDAGNGRLGLLTGQIASGEVTANVNDNTISATLTSADDAIASSVDSSGNRIDARSTVNDARTVFADDLPANLVGLLGSDATAITTATLQRGDFDTQLVDVEGGSINVASSQIATGVALDSTATADRTEILIDLTALTTVSDANDSALTADSNEIRSTLIGNTAVASTDLSVDTGFSGTGSVLNQQQVGDGTADIELISQSLGNVLSAALTDQTDSSVSVSQNTVGTSASGNIARDGAAAGTFLSVNANQITSAGGEAQVDSSTTDQLSLGGAFVAGTQQQIAGDGAASAIEAINNLTSVSVNSENVARSSIALDQNTVFSLAKGNDAATDIALSGTGIDASAALGNQQSVVDTSVVAGPFFGGGGPSNVTATVAGTIDESSVSINGNAFVGRADGNIAVNQLSASSDTSLTRTSPNNRAALFSTDADARGGFVLGSEQTFIGTSNTLTSVIDTDLAATIGTATSVGDISDSSLSINENQQSSVGMVNQVQNEIDLTAASIGAGTNAVSSIISNLQDVDVADVTATSTLDAVLDQQNYNTGVGALSIADSSLSVDGNQNRATVSGNEAVNRLLNTSETGIVGNLVNESRANLTGSFSIRATSVLANEQSVTAASLDSEAVTNASLDSNNGGGEVGIDASSLSLNQNLTAAASSGNTASSFIEQSAGTQSGATAALRSVQTTEVDNTTADAVVQFLMDTRGTGTDTSFEIDNNQIFASGAGNIAQSSVNADVTSFDGPADSVSYNARFDPTSSVLGQSRADFALLSDQNQTGSIDATANVGALIRLRATANDGGFLTESTASIDNTFIRADALANEANNTVDFAAAAEAIDVTGAVASRQTSEGEVTATATTAGSPDQLVITSLRGLIESSISVNENVSVASAGANMADNRLMLKGASLSGATEAADFVDFGARIDADNGLASARSDASVANFQETAATGSINATAGLKTRLSTNEFDLERSSASINANSVRSSGQANEAVNIVDVIADTQATVASAVANLQNSLADINVDSTFTGAIVVASNVADANSGLDQSVATLDGNISVATANANIATSLLRIEASSIEGLSGAGQGAFVALPVPTLTASSARADNVVASQQNSTGTVDVVSNSDSGVSVRGDIDQSSVSLSGNIGQSAAIANKAINGVDLVASTDSSGTSAVSNEQSGTANIAASTEVTVTLRQNIEGTADPSITSSAIAMDDNLSISAAQGNDATNTLAIAGASVTGRENTTDLTTDDGAITGFTANTSDNVVASDQRRTGGSSISSSANVVADALRNSDENVGDTTVDTPSSLTGSSVSISRNIADSTSSANKVTNTIALNADTKLETSAGLVNTQSSDNPVTSDVQLTTRIGSEDFGDVSGSSVALNGNVGVARANGNDSVNRMSALSSTQVSGASSTGGSASLATGGSTVLNASADFAMLNNQTNSGDVTARASSSTLPTSMQVTTDGAVLNSSFSLSGNALVADASSNRSVSQMTVSGRSPSENVSVGLANRQVASGPVISGVDSFRLSSASGDITGSSVRLGGNQISASASGNTGRTSFNRD